MIENVKSYGMENETIISWVSPKLVRVESKVSGVTLSANENIKKNEMLIVQGGRILNIKDVDDEMNQNLAYHGFQIKADLYIYPFISPHGAAILDGIFLINHSCSPNCGFVDAITLVSMRDISKGEEISFDYAMTDVETDAEIPWVPEECKCASQNCRGLITGSDWKILELQEEYKGYFSPYISLLIADMKREG